MVEDAGVIVTLAVRVRLAGADGAEADADVGARADCKYPPAEPGALVCEPLKAA